MTDVFTANLRGRIAGRDIVQEYVEAVEAALGAPVLIGSDGVILQFQTVAGLGVTVVADSRTDAEERLRRTFGDDIVVEQLEILAPLPDVLARGFRLLAHAGEPCTDHDCEVHHPGAIEDPREQLPALAWFEAGRRARKSTS